MKNLLLSLILLGAFHANAQELATNLDFEQVQDSSFVGMSAFGSEDFKISVDQKVVHSGKHAVRIQYAGDSGQFRALSFNIPSVFKGRKIKLTGYIKTENVQGGYAGLWMRIDPRVDFDNMNDRGIRGTTDWAKYEIELNLRPSQSERVVFGGIMTGSGTMWLDNMELTIDGKSLKDAPRKEIPPAAKDKEFILGSRVTFPAVSNQLIEDLDVLGRVWGFLKYHHPAIAKGNHNWDFELFRVLPQYLSATKAEKEGVLLDWIDKLGVVEECSSCKAVSEDAFLKPDHAWMTGEKLGYELSERLSYILANRYQGRQYYIQFAPGVGNPIFANEDAYAEAAYPDEGFRLLTLYRYWNAIHYFFPYRHLIDKDWNAVLAEYIPRFIEASNEYEFEMASLQLIGDIKDTHANLWGGRNAIEAARGKYYPPVRATFVEDKLVVVDFYNQEHQGSAGLAIGDVITKIGGTPVQELVEKALQNYPASNRPTQLRDLGENILRSNESSLNIHYSRAGEEQALELALFEQKDLNYYRWYRREPDGKSYRWLEEGVGYITLKNIKSEDIPEIKKTFANARGIVIDIRNYPSTFVPFALGGFFVDERTPFARFTSGNSNNPGAFTMGRNVEISPQETHFKGKVVVLVNEISQSQAEYTSMGFRAGVNTTIIGSTTAGADGNVSNIPLPGGMRTMISGIGVYYPDGKETQRVGIVPDLEIRPTIQGIREGKDEVLNKAIELINLEGPINQRKK